MSHSMEVEIERNYATFAGLLRDLLVSHHGKYALLHNQKLEGIYPTAIEAGRAGLEKFDSRPFSIQRVSDEPVDLGFYSYASSDRPPYK